MAKSAKKKQGLAGLIFIWILIILLAVGTIEVFRNYQLSKSSLLNSQELAKALAVTFDKNPADITEEDLASIDIIEYTDKGSTSDVVYFLKGFTETYDAYLNGETTDTSEISKLVGGASISDKGIYDDMHLFTDVTSITFINESGKTINKDILKIASDNYPNLTTFITESYDTADFSVIKNLSKLESLEIVDTTLTDISAISSLENLKVINLSKAGLTDISALKSLDNEKIEVVYLVENNITDWSPIDHIDTDKVTKVIESETENDDESESEAETEAEVTEESESTEENS